MHELVFIFPCHCRRLLSVYSVTQDSWPFFYRFAAHALALYAMRAVQRLFVCVPPEGVEHVLLSGLFQSYSVTSPSHDEMSVEVKNVNFVPSSSTIYVLFFSHNFLYVSPLMRFLLFLLVIMSVYGYGYQFFFLL